MNYQEKVKFLESYIDAKQRAESYAIEIQDLRQTVYPSGIHISDMPKHQSYEDQMANYAGEYWEIMKRLEKAESRQLHVVAVINQIADIDPLGHRILVERYIKGEKTEVVCRTCYISRKTEWRHRRNAIMRLKI